MHGKGRRAGLAYYESFKGGQVAVKASIPVALTLTNGITTCLLRAQVLEFVVSALHSGPGYTRLLINDDWLGVSA